MKYHNHLLKFFLLLVLSGSATSLSASASLLNRGNVLWEDGPVVRTYANKSASDRIGASSWKFHRRKGSGNRQLDKSMGIEITYADFLNHLGIGQDRTVKILRLSAGAVLPMDVGDEDVTDGVWIMPDLSLYPALQSNTYYSLDTEDLAIGQFFNEPTHAFQLDANSYQFIKLTAPADGNSGSLDNLGYSYPNNLYEMNSLLTPVPMTLGLGVYESEFGPASCEFFGGSCLELDGEDHFTIVQTYEEVASGLLTTYDGETSEAIKLRNTDSVTIFNADSAVLEVVVMDYLVWYSKNGHYVKARITEDQPWSGATTFKYFEYQKLAESALPVEWLAINAEAIKNREVKVNWSTATESQNERFVVERSEDGTRFSAIGELAAVGDSQEQQDYSFTDESPVEGFNYYRIQQQDYNGRNTYSAIVSALVTKTSSDEELVVLYPNPGRNEVYFSQPANYELLSISGQVLAKGRAEQALDVNGLPAGTYLVRIDGGKAFRWVKL